MQAAVSAGMGMLKSIGALVAMSGIVRMLEQLLRAPQLVLPPRGSDSGGTQEYGPVVLKDYTLWGNDSDSFVSHLLAGLPKSVQQIARDTFRWIFLWGPFAHRGCC